MRVGEMSITTTKKIVFISFFIKMLHVPSRMLQKI